MYQMRPLTLFLRRCALLQIAFVAGFLCASEIVRADEYAPGGAPEIGAIVHQTVFDVTGLNRNRTDIGIGEEVTLQIDPGTWSDTDCNLTTKDDDAWDEMGEISWSKIGRCDLSAIAGGSITMTAHHTGGDATVQATVQDSQTHNGAQESVPTAALTFSVKVPTGQNAVKNTDLVIGSQDLPVANRTHIGAHTSFTATILLPTVCFQNARICKNYARTDWTWPDSTAGFWGPFNGHNPVAVPADPAYWASCVVTGHISLTNQWPEIRSFGNYNRTLLTGLTSPNEFTMPLKCSMDYKDHSGNWQTFLDDTAGGHNCVIWKDHTSGQGKVRMRGSNGDQDGGWMGPWD